MPLLYHNNNSISNITSFAQVPSGSPVLLSTATASGSSSISFTSGIDSTYDVYYFEFINMHPQNDSQVFSFQGSTNGGSSYGITITSTVFNANQPESGASTLLDYNTVADLAQSTGEQSLTRQVGNDNDQSTSGELYLFNPSSLIFVKHFISTTQTYRDSDLSQQQNTAGYFNDSANDINAIRFKFASGNIDAGTIKMYGIKA